MKSIFAPFVLLLLLVAAVVAQESEPACDLATVEKAFYCQTDDLVLEKKQLVSDVALFVCTECDVTEKEAGPCAECDTALTKKVSGKDVCPECYAKPAACEACVKYEYVCPGCSDSAAAAGDCGECESARTKTRAAALVEYVCAGCSGTSLTPAKCSDEECDDHGKALARTCAESGSAPHVKAK